MRCLGRFVRNCITRGRSLDGEPVLFCTKVSHSPRITATVWGRATLKSIVFFLGTAAPTTRDVGRRQVPHRAQLYATIPWRGSAPANDRATNLDPRLPRNPGRCHAEMRPQPVACHRGSSAGHGSVPAVFPIATAICNYLEARTASRKAARHHLLRLLSGAAGGLSCYGRTRLARWSDLLLRAVVARLHGAAR